MAKRHAKTDQILRALLQMCDPFGIIKEVTSPELQDYCEENNLSTSRVASILSDAFAASDQIVDRRANNGSFKEYLYCPGPLLLKKDWKAIHKLITKNSRLKIIRARNNAATKTTVQTAVEPKDETATVKSDSHLFHPDYVKLKDELGTLEGRIEVLTNNAKESGRALGQKIIEITKLEGLLAEADKLLEVQSNLLEDQALRIQGLSSAVKTKDIDLDAAQVRNIGLRKDINILKINVDDIEGIVEFKAEQIRILNERLETANKKSWYQFWR